MAPPSGTRTEERPVATRGPLPVDPPHPRFRARRIEVRRDEGRRRRHRLFVLVVVVALVAGAAALLRSPLTDVDRVTVVGASETPSAAVVEASTVELTDPLIDVDPGAAARLVEALPWIEQARVERLWPSSVRIEVIERVAVAQVATAGGWAEVDAEGHVLQIDESPAPGLVQVAGARAGAPGSVLDAGELASLELAAQLPADLAAAVATVNIEGATLSLTLREGDIPVELG